MPAVEVVIPWQGSCPHRVAALRWIRDRYRQLGWAVTVAPYPDKPWVKARAVNPAVAASSAEVVVVADADCWAPDVAEAVETVLLGEPVVEAPNRRRPPRRSMRPKAVPEWAVPFYWVHRFTPEFTGRVLNGADPARHTSVSLEEKQYRAKDGGGIVVVRRDAAVDVPMDPRFVGWGGEDMAWGTALRTLHGRPWRAAGELWHLWHPPQDRPDRTVMPAENYALRVRYTETQNNPTAMRRLINELP